MPYSTVRRVQHQKQNFHGNCNGRQTDHGLVTNTISWSTRCTEKRTRFTVAHCLQIELVVCHLNVISQELILEMVLIIMSRGRLQ